jgi:aspartate-semialdehyde dehydrogenase
MDPTKKLVIPEINGDLLEKSDKIIANPNCSTIQMLMALAPLHKAYKVKRVIVSTYQSITGTGVKAVQQLENEREKIMNYILEMKVAGKSIKIEGNLEFSAINL